MMEAEAKASEDTGGDAADGTGQGGGDDTAEAAVDKSAHETPRDERDEVRKCLEHILSECTTAAGIASDVGRDSENVTLATGVDSGVAATKQGPLPSGTDLGDEGEHGASEALLPGFQLSAKEQKKVGFNLNSLPFPQRCLATAFAPFVNPAVERLVGAFCFTRWKTIVLRRFERE